MKITFPNGTVVEATPQEILDSKNAIDSYNLALKSIFGDNAVDLWQFLKNAAGLG